MIKMNPRRSSSSRRSSLYSDQERDAQVLAAESFSDERGLLSDSDSEDEENEAPLDDGSFGIAQRTHSFHARYVTCYAPDSHRTLCTEIKPISSVDLTDDQYV
jgi:hypothetical protein